MNGRLKSTAPTTCLKYLELTALMSRFVVEASREDGKPYPASTLTLLAGLYHYCKLCIPKGGSCTNRKDLFFHQLTGAIQVRFRALRESSVGAVVKHTPVVTTTEEDDTLWKQ